jgi:RNA polymerase sigma-70 factor (ECF subfamily)
MSTASPETARRDDAQLLASLRRGDEAAFVELIRAHHAALLAVAMTYVSSRAVAEEIVRETWLGVLEGLDRFAGRSSPKTWIFEIATNIARTRGARDRRSRPVSSPAGADDTEPSVDPGRFLPADHPTLPGRWARPPAAWERAEDRLRSRRTQDLIREAISRLPSAQRLVLTLRDVEGWSAKETCDALDLSPAHQRVLLHRARSSVRGALERHLGAADRAA